MSGIIFYKTRDRRGIAAFYTERVGMRPWMERADVTLLRHGNMILGFHQQPEADIGAMITFVYPDRAAVDMMRRKMADFSATVPRVNERYGIYQFFAHDPEGRTIEFQSFEEPTPPLLDAVELLTTRRSVREYTGEPITAAMLEEVFDLVPPAPSARNTQPWSFIVVRDQTKLALLSAVRQDSSAPIARAPLAIAVTADPELTPTPMHDASIMAYHLMLAAWAYGLGTVWIGRMDRDDVKEILGIPSTHYVGTVLPLGRPAERPAMRPRNPLRVREV